MELLTLGHFLRNLRKDAPVLVNGQVVRRGLKQAELAHRIGWGYPAHISEIENDKRLPTADTIRRWVEACGGGDDDLACANGLAGYGHVTRFPPLAEIVPLLQRIEHDSLKAHPYPCYVIDYTNRIWLINDKGFLFYDDPSLLSRALRRPLNLFHLIFDSQLPHVRQLQDLGTVRADQIALFKAVNWRRRHEPFFLSFERLVCRHLLSEDAEAFVSAWRWRNPHDQSAGYHAQRLVFNLSDGEQLRFVVVSEYAAFSDNIFAVVRYTPDPSDPQNVRRIDARVARLPGRPPIRVWELVDEAVMLTPGM